MKRLSVLIKYCNNINIIGSTDIDISGIAYDSRMAEKGYAFFALPGTHTDGNRFIKNAFENGASVVFTEKEPEEFISGLTYIIAENTRDAMSSFSSAYYDFPSEKLNIIGVTGTDGKSSTVSFIYQLLKKAGYKAGFISTVEYDCSGNIEKNPYRQSTPESPEIMKILSRMADNNFHFAVLESTSHGLSEKTARLKDVKYNSAVLTNISHEHLEFHGSIENYVNDKANLFRKATDFCVVNNNEKYSSEFIKVSAADIYSYTGAAADSITKNSSDLILDEKTLTAENIESDGITTKFNICFNGKDYPVKMNIPGIFNVDNVLASVITASLSSGKDLSIFTELVETLQPVTGRMDTVEMGQPFSVIVDYAHTPGAFTKIFPLIKQTVKNRLITVFGSAGERDTEKRAIQGKIAGKYSEIVILTDEDPRGEDGMEILEDIKAGISSDFDPENIYLIPDRQEAINKAVDLAEPGDTVILLGKGHESSIIYAEGKIDWDERKAAVNALSAAGYTG